MRRTITMGAALAALAMAGVAIGRTGADACPEGTLAGALDGVAAATAGAQVAALHEDGLAVIGPTGQRTTYDTQVTGVARHLAVTPGAGLAFVDDVRGPDRVVVATADGVRRLDATGEVSHPDVSPTGSVVWSEDMARLRLHTGNRLADLPTPSGAAVFSPVFAPDGAIVAVVEERVEPVAAEGEVQSNLWRLDPATRRWTALTSFQGSAERWTAVRTPVAAEDGGLLFVRLSGDPSATRPAAHELWKVDAAGARKLRDLPHRRFLAGAHGDALYWNDEVDGEWRLRSEGPAGTRDLGCGRVMVDPLVELDPDLLVDGEPPAGIGADDLAGGPATAPLAVVVGDFASRAEASAVAERLGGLRVIDHRGHPGAVAPGAFAVALPLPADADVEAALVAFRSRFPAYAERSWITTLG